MNSLLVLILIPHSMLAQSHFKQRICAPMIHHTRHIHLFSVGAGTFIGIGFPMGIGMRLGFGTDLPMQFNPTMSNPVIGAWIGAGSFIGPHILIGSGVSIPNNDDDDEFPSGPRLN